MSTPQGGDAKRLGGIPYKVIGGAVVGLAILVAVVPLWWGGGEERSDVIEIDPDNVATPGGSAPTEPESASEGSEDSGQGSQKGAGAGSEGDQPEKTAKAGEQTAGDSGSASGDGETPWWKEGASGSTPSVEDAQPTKRDSGSGARGAPAKGPMATGPDKTGDDSDSASQAGADGASSSGTASAESQPEESGPVQKQASTKKSAPGAGEDASAKTGNGEDGIDRPWRIMSGSFQDAANARERRDRIRDKGFEADVVDATVNGEQWHRVYVGKLSSREEAQAHKRELKRAGFEEMLIMRTDG